MKRTGQAETAKFSSTDKKMGLVARFFFRLRLRHQSRRARAPPGGRSRAMFLSEDAFDLDGADEGYARARVVGRPGGGARAVAPPPPPSRVSSFLFAARSREGGRTGGAPPVPASPCAGAWELLRSPGRVPRRSPRALVRRCRTRGLRAFGAVAREMRAAPRRFARPLVPPGCLFETRASGTARPPPRAPPLPSPRR